MLKHCQCISSPQESLCNLGVKEEKQHLEVGLHGSSTYKVKNNKYNYHRSKPMII